MKIVQYLAWSCGLHQWVTPVIPQTTPYCLPRTIVTTPPRRDCKVAFFTLIFLVLHTPSSTASENARHIGVFFGTLDVQYTILTERSSKTPILNLLSVYGACRSGLVTFLMKYWNDLEWVSLICLLRMSLHLKYSTSGSESINVYFRFQVATYNCSNSNPLKNSSALAEFSLVSLPCTRYDDESARRSCDDHLYTYK